MTATAVNTGLAARAMDALRSSRFWIESTRNNGKSVAPLVCPECGKPEAWAYSNGPFTIICNRANACGARTKTIELFGLRQKVEADFPASEQEPGKPAEMFLRLRGIESALKGLRFEYWSNVRGTGSGAVMFPIGDGAYNGRVFNPPPGEGKTHNKGSSSGKFWKHPGVECDTGKPLFAVEGIIDALSLIEIGQQAIAVLSAGQDPGKLDLSEFGEVVTAFDNDEAGQKATKKWAEFAAGLPKGSRLNISAILPPTGQDWNDFLLRHGGDAAARFEEQLQDFQFFAQLALSKSAQQYATLYLDHKGAPAGLFSFDGQYHYAFLKDSKEGPIPMVSRVSNFTLKVEHFEIDNTDAELPVFKYRLRVAPRKGRPCRITARGTDLKSPDGLTGFFLNHAKVVWRGDRAAGLALAEMIVNAKAPIVRAAQLSGFDHESGWYLFRHFAFDKAGKLAAPDSGGFYKVSSTQHARPPLHPSLKPGNTGIDTARQVYNLICGAWGDRGRVGVACLVKGWFAPVFKPVIGFDPFLSMLGDPQTGKSALMRVLNAMQGLPGEGLPMSTANTKKGELRRLSQVSGLTAALLEGNSQESSRFDFESILPLYNAGNPLQTRALTSNDNRTVELPFHGSLAFVMNREPFQSRAAKERLISVEFKVDDLDDQTRQHFQELQRVKPEDCVSFMLAVMAQRVRVEGAWERSYIKYREQMRRDVDDNRIAENHALVLLFHQVTCQCLGIEYDLFPFLVELARKKAESCRAREVTAADYFFECLNNLPDSETSDFLKIDGRRVAICLPLARQAIGAAGLQADFPHTLVEQMKKHGAFVEGGKNTRFNGVVRKAMVFDVATLGR